jgi:hypothetical protein
MGQRWPFHWLLKATDERGQALILFAAGLVGFIALVGMAVDVGQVVQTRTDLQKTADAAAFAAAQDLPNIAAAEATAADYVNVNSNGSAFAVIAFGAGNTSVTVEAHRRVDYAFLRVVGLGGTDVSARASVRVGSYSGGSGLMPWGLIANNSSNSELLGNDCYVNTAPNGNVVFLQNTPCRLKSGAGSNAGGDFGALALDGPGADTYRDSIINGSTNTFSRGDRVNPQTGNVVGPTRQGMDARFSLPSPAGCPGHGRDQVLIDNPTNGTVSIRPNCEHSPRIVVIPVVDQINNPQQSEILGFAFMFLTGLHNVGGGQGHTEVYGEFVHFVSDLPGAEYNDTGHGASAIRLTE